MSTLQQFRSGLGRVWENLGEGWRQLQDMAAHALTRFHPVHREGEEQEGETSLLRSSPRWGFLAAEVTENDKQIEVRLEIPGMEKEDFVISVVDHTLVVRGEKRLERKTTRGRYHITECSYGSFERALPLPATVDETKAKAKYRRGVLRISLPKTKQGTSGRIPVEAG